MFLHERGQTGDGVMGDGQPKKGQYYHYWTPPQNNYQCTGEDGSLASSLSYPRTKMEIRDKSLANKARDCFMFTMHFSGL